MVGTKGILPFAFHIAFWRDPSAEYRSPARLGDGGRLSPHRSFYCHTTYITYTSLVSTLVRPLGLEPRLLRLRVECFNPIKLRADMRRSRFRDRMFPTLRPGRTDDIYYRR